MEFPVSPVAKACALIGVVTLAGGISASAAVSYATAGSGYTQNFNTLATSGASNAWTNDSTLAGWYAAQVGSITTNWSTYAAASGGAQQGALLSIGTGTNTDRALGGQNESIANPTVSTMYYGLQLTNSTGLALTNFSLSYAGEQWRVVQSEARDKMVLEYQIFAAGTGSLLAASGWTTATSLGFEAPIVTGDSSTNLNGNSAANRVLVNGSVSGITWSDGTELWLRWSDASTGTNAATGGTRSMLGIDDLTFSADVVPEPSGLLLSGLGVGLLAVRRRVR